MSVYSLHCNSAIKNLMAGGTAQNSLQAVADTAYEQVSHALNVSLPDGTFSSPKAMPIRTPEIRTLQEAPIRNRKPQL